MTALLGMALTVILGFGLYLVGYVAGKRAAYREWLLALLDEAPADFDGMLVAVLEEIQRDDAA